MEANPDIVQGFMDWGLMALTSVPTALCVLPQYTEGLFELAVSALELQERVGLQKTIQLLVGVPEPFEPRDALSDAC